MKLREMTKLQLADLAEIELDTEQAYAVALERKRRFGVQSALANEVCWCHDCQTEFSCESPSYLYIHSRTRCIRCGENVNLSLRHPAPREPQPEPPTWQEMLRQIRERFGD